MPFSGPVGRDEIVRRIAAHPLGDAPEEMRAGFARLVLGDAGPPAPPDGVTVTEGAHGLVVSPNDPLSMPPVVWFHGGGYVFGAPETHLRIAFHLALSHGLTVHLPRYRLAPEAPWPAQRADGAAALEGLDAPILAGDSAGGHLALTLALDRAAAGERTTALLLFSPNTDRTGRSGTREAMEDGDPMVDDVGDQALAAMCFGDRPGTDPDVSPTLRDLSGLPPTWIEAGRPEVLLGDAELLRDAAGGRAELHVTDGLLHMGQVWAPWWAEARASLDRAARFALARA